MIKYDSTTAEEAVKLIQSGNRVFIHSVAAAPQKLIAAMTARHKELRDVEIVQLHTEGEAPYSKPEMADSFWVNALFIGINVRKAISVNRSSYVPVFLSEVPNLFRRGILPLDVAMIQVSPPDKHGYCSMGTSIDASFAAQECAKYVIAEINPNMPRTLGDGMLHISKFDAIVEVDYPIHEHPPRPVTDVERRIGKYVASLIEDGSTLQMGIGAIPDAVLAQLGGHKNLGIHTEMFSDGVIDLVKNGVITGSEKSVRKGKIVAGFVMGSKRLYDFIDDNPMVEMRDISFVNDVTIIRRNKKAVSINSAIEVDLTGQVCADSIGTRMYSGVGGQMDFIRGASLSEGGKPIIALPSTTSHGESRISAFLKQGAGVVTTRAHVHYVVTEYGVAHLYGKNIRQRAELLTNIAHPDHREGLQRAYAEFFRSNG
jgi:acyl-CoA hydrolase